MKLLEKLVSQEDLSVNFVYDNGAEARYVRRNADYFIIYVSTHTGCKQACRFCHLTQTRQTNEMPLSLIHLEDQVEQVLQHYIDEVMAKRQAPLQKVHINFMARGDALTHEELIEYWFEFTKTVADMVQQAGLSHPPVFNISTIFPQGEKEMKLPGLFLESDYRTQIYYSMYSVNPEFRKKWIPRGIEPSIALEYLRRWKDHSSQRGVVLHWALIKDENDSEKDAREVASTVYQSGVYARFNLVRYNPYSPVQGEEPDEETLNRYFETVKAVMASPGSRIVPRVGRDVAASCGCFIQVNPVKRPTLTFKKS